jgi:hypothetical protein
LEIIYGTSGASGLTRYHIFRKVELILSSAYYSGKLFRSVRRISETGGGSAMAIGGESVGRSW